MLNEMDDTEMSIYNPSQDSILWAHNIAQQDCEVIEDTLETMVIDSEFAERLCALVAIIKSGESSFGEWDCELAGVIQEILDDNKNLEFLGQGSYSSCFADSNNNVYKINLHVEAVDPWLSYAESCMTNNKNPLLPVIYSVYKHDDTYCAIMERLEEVSESSIEILKHKLEDISSAIIENDAATLDQIAPTSLFTITKHICQEFLDVLNQASQNYTTYSTEKCNLDIRISNIMMRKNQAVFIDPLY